MSVTSPKFNEDLDIVLILVKTDYNLTAFKSKENQLMLQIAMNEFNDFLVVGPNSKKPKKIFKSDGVYKIPK